MHYIAEMLDEQLQDIVDGCFKRMMIGGCLLLIVVFLAGFGIGLLF